ncbi:MAG: hypothetical protein EOM30_10650 [Clostridia bacterium]|nr:hypothetical protein [Clostridia bacterium]
MYNYQNDLKMTGENGAKFGAGWTPLEWGGASYDFITKRNSVTFTLPSDWSGASYSLTGAVTSSGYGAEAGAHRSIGRVNGESPNLAAVSRSYDYSVLPKIVIPVHQKPKSDIYATTGDWIYKNTQNPIVSSTGGEWAVIGLARAGYAVSDGYYASYASNVISTLIKNNGVLHAKKYTEYSRAVLALTAIGYDVTNVGGYNLLDRLADFDAVCWQGVNGPIWALLALDSHGYEIPVAPSFKTRTTREKLVSAILEKELTSGGWTLAGNAADVDMTAMAIQALAPYYPTNGAVKAAVDRALNKLSQLQNENGGFGIIDGASAESSAQVIVALTALGIDPDADSRFIKNGSTVVASLNSFYVDGGGFSHGANGSRDGIATEQGYYALAAYNRFKAGKSSLFNMSDVKIADAVQIVNSLINSIGSVTIDSGNTIKAARTAYDALADSQKSMINNLQALIDAENTYKALIAKVDNVSALISKLNDVKYSAQFKALMDEARSAYNALNEAEQKHVAGYPLLTAAERKYTQLENAQRVIELIDAIGTVTKNSADKIDAARSAYDALSNAEKTLVTNYSVLTAAERKLTALVAGGSTKVIGNGNTKLSLNGITYMVDAEAATLMKQIDTLTKAKKLNMKLLATAYTAYMDMSDKLKAQVFNYDDLEALTNKAGEENHTDAATGIQIEDAPWYVKINVKKSVDKSVSDIIKNSIGSNEMLMLWDINLINMLEGAEYYPDASITLSAPADDLSRFSQVRIAHYDGSKNEYLDCTVADGRITWQTQSFSTFAVIASEAATLNELENSDKPSVMAATSPEAQAESPMWVIVLIFALTAAGIAAMAVVIILKRKAKR